MRAGAGPKRALLKVPIGLGLMLAMTAAPAVAGKVPDGNYPGGESWKGVFFFSVRGEATNDYNFLISGYSERWGDRLERGNLNAYQPQPGRDRGGLSASYLQERRIRSISRTHVKFDLGPRGSVELAFRPTRVKKRTYAGCEGSYTKRKGIFTGVIDFNPETPYTTLPSRIRLPGSFDIRRLYNCDLRAGKRDPAQAPAVLKGARGVQLGACDGRSYEFFATDDRGSRPVFSLYAPVEQIARRILVVRNAILRGGTFEYAADLSSASVAGPPPYVGQATFTATESGVGEVHGPLELELPGAARTTRIDSVSAELDKVLDYRCARFGPSPPPESEGPIGLPGGFPLTAPIPSARRAPEAPGYRIGETASSSSGQT